MKQCITLLTAMIFSLLLKAQTPGNTVKGTVMAGQKPAEAASVLLLKSTDSVIVRKTMSNADGSFTVEAPAGKYILAVEYVGFKKLYSQPFEVSNSNTSIVMPPLSLEPEGQQLNAVVITSKKPFIEQKLDKTVVNVDASPTNVGLSALEVLEKSPGITVDKDGNVSLKGKQGVLILMDGKPTYLSGQDLANLLRNTPSNNLDQIEIMTNPPAKFDASGNSGVINIKTKKTKMKGMNGSVTVGGGIGNKPKTNESFQINYRNGKVNLFGNYSYSYNYNPRTLQLDRIFRDEATGDLLTTFRQETDMTNKFQSHNYKAGIDFFASKKTTLGFVFNGYYSPGGFTNTNTTNLFNAADVLQSVTITKSSSHEKWKNSGLNFNLKQDFDSTSELTADLDYVHYNSGVTQMFDTYFYDDKGGATDPVETLRGLLPSDITIYSGKTDFSKSFKKDLKLEAGLKSSYVKTDNNAQYDNLIDDQWQSDTGRTNHFVYKENINAAYVNLRKEFSKQWSMQTGVRMENTISDGNQLTTGQTFKRNYTQLFPTVYLGYNMNDKNSFSLSYGRRIDRPDYGDLNPFYYFLDKYTYQVGNPYINPQFTHNIELGYSFNNFLNTTISYNATNDVIAEVLEQIDSTYTNYVKKGNIAKNRSLGLSSNANFPVTKGWRANIYAQVIYNSYKGFVNNGDIDVSATGFMTNFSNQFEVKNGWKFELSGFYRSKMIEGTLVAKPMGVLNFAVAKSVLKNKGSIRLNLRDFLDIQQFRGYSKYQNIDVTIRNQWDNRVVSVGFTYRFNKGKAGNVQHKESSASDEQNRVKTGGN